MPWQSSRSVLGSIVVSIPACHAGDPGSIPGRGVVILYRKCNINLYINLKSNALAIFKICPR